jgi:hypothetical protein
MNFRITIPGRKYILTCLVQGKKNDSPIELGDGPRINLYSYSKYLRCGLRVQRCLPNRAPRVNLAQAAGYLRTVCVIGQFAEFGLVMRYAYESARTARSNLTVLALYIGLLEGGKMGGQRYTALTVMVWISTFFTSQVATSF